ncbi:type I restriction endonuclease subunit S [Latilactobacillus curvatus]|uniref:restriction endonuclease subunit S n=1 Tax=Latilactobacillus curvatus TaxID=28038 RepID=UPI0008151386|nr:restriction endonuclease subunit S [Latilactobacillus curvatus]ANY13598.1 type I restriction endonuclease subunit S [Latilactobacillus curvatus]
MKEQKKQPELRFKGFTDDWEQRKFGELYKKNLERNKDHFSSDRTISIATMRFKKEGNGAAENSLVSYKVLREGDIAFEGHTSKRFAFGRFVLNDIGDGIMSPRFTTLRPTQDMPIKFWKQYIHYEPIMRYPIVNSTKLGTMMNELVVDEFLNQPVLVPELSEQQKIGSFFKQLDNTITLQQRKLDLLTKLKQGYLQQLFPSKDKYLPRLRFKEFNGDWKQCTMGEIFTERTERSGEGELISVTINSGVVKASELDRKDNSSKNKSNYKKVEIGDIAYNSMRMWQGASGYSPYKGILSPAYTVITPKNEIDSEFFAYDFKRFNMIQAFKRNSQGLTSDTWNLKFPTLKSIKINVPHFDEQRRISNTFNQVDNMLLLQQTKIDQLNKLKQGYLQKLFP